MTGSDVVAVAVYALLTGLAGHAVLGLLRCDGSVRNWATAYLAGQLAWLACCLLATWCGWPAPVVLAAAALALLPAGGVLTARACARLPARAGVCAAAAVALFAMGFPNLVYTVARVPLVEWDARSIWFFHGKAIWCDQGIWPSFFADAHFEWSHLDYPLLIPVQAALVALLRGAWSEMAVKAFLLVNLAAYVYLFATVLRRRRWPVPVAAAAAFLAAGIAGEAYVNGYADNHYAMPLAIAALAVTGAHRTRDRGLATLAALLAVYALNVKSEALIFVAAGVATNGVLRVAGAFGRRHDAAEPAAAGPRTAWGALAALAPALVGLLPFALWSGFKLTHGLRNDLRLSDHLWHPAAALHQMLARAPEIARVLAIIHKELGTPVALCVILMIALWRRSARDGGGACRYGSGGDRSCERLMWAWLLVAHLLLFVVYGLTPHDLAWHLGTSADRLLVLPALLAAGLLVDMAEPIFAGAGARGDARSGPPPAPPVGDGSRRP